MIILLKEWCKMARKGLYIKVTEEQHKKYKMYCAKNNTNLTKVVLEYLDGLVGGDTDGLGRTTKETD